MFWKFSQKFRSICAVFLSSISSSLIKMMLSKIKSEKLTGTKARLQKPPKYYRFDSETLLYKPVGNWAKLRLSTVLISSLFGFLIMFTIFLLLPTFDLIVTPKLMSQSRELQNYKVRFDELSEKFGEAEKQLKSIAIRDQKLYRVTYQASPIPEERINAGSGGTARYSRLEGYENSNQIIETTKRLDNLLSSIASQSYSLEELEAIVEDKDDQLRAMPSILPIKNDAILRFSSGFGHRIDPFTHKRKMHKGIDFSAPTGTPIYATGDGKIVQADARSAGYGKLIRINHGYGYESVYGHLSRYNVRRGQSVKRGDLIGYVGNTGRSKGPHLHYEVRKNGVHQNPIHFYYGSLSPEEFDAILKRSIQETQSLD